MDRIRPLALLLLLPVLLSSCGDEGMGSSESTEAGPGRLVIIGGGLQAETVQVYQAILDGRDGAGPVCVFPTASAEPQESMESAMARFDAVGGEGTAQGIYLTEDNPEDASLPETVARIGGCSGFYFVGGQQSRIVRVFRPEEGDSPAYEALMARFQDGAVVSGSSAGAAIMNDPMIGGGSSVGALQEGVRTTSEGEGVRLQKGMGFLDATFVDQHFLARGRWARLLVAVLATDGIELGTGIDENTALVVEGDSAWVVGASGVAYYDTREVVRDGAGHAGSGIVLHLLGPGDGLNLETGEVQVQAGKTTVPGTGEGFDGSGVDLFERWALLRFLHAAAISSDTVFGFNQDGHAFEFRKGQGFQVRALEGEGVQSVPRGLFAGPFELSVLAEGGV
jgi:cyanophycinase